MKLTKCANGHFFDNDKYASCPYCGKVESPVTEPVTVTEVPELTLPERPVVPVGHTVPERPVAPVGQTIPERPSMPVGHTVPEVGTAPETTAGAEPAAESVQEEPSPEPAVWQPAASDNRTVSYYARTIGTEPVVGWLVAIEGPYFGEDFKLKSGRNFIGRSPEMDIQLGMDMSVSRRRHAVIIYEPRGKIFLAQPGDSRELFYLNEEVVLGNVQLKPYDVLSIGETKLLFIPLCGKEFSWDAVKKEQ